MIDRIPKCEFPFLFEYSMVQGNYTWHQPIKYGRFSAFWSESLKITATIQFLWNLILLKSAGLWKVLESVKFELAIEILVEWHPNKDCHQSDLLEPR